MASRPRRTQAELGEISERSGVSRGGIFRHFASRLDLIVAAAEEVSVLTSVLHMFDAEAVFRASHPRPELEEQRLALATHLLTTMEEYE